MITALIAGTSVATSLVGGYLARRRNAMNSMNNVTKTVGSAEWRMQLVVQQAMHDMLAEARRQP